MMASAATRGSMMIRTSRLALRQSNIIQSRLFSSSTEAPTQLFPWRSDPILLKRLQNPDDLSGTPSQTLWSRWARQGLVARQLQVDFLGILLGSWKRDLASDLQWAFQKGLSGLLSNVLSVPMDKIDKEDDGIDIDTSKFDEKDNAGTFGWTDEQSEFSKEYVKRTFQNTFSSSYTPFDRTTHDLRLKLQPMNYDLEHAFVIPVITRDAIEKDSSLLNLYHDLDQSILSNASSYDDVKEQVEDLIKKAGGSRTTFTLVVDVAVECRELFWVTEKESGTVVQGSKDNENVVMHLVRFEMVLTKINTFGSWIIADIDDMLGGNVWHLRNEDDASSSKEEAKEDDEPASQEKNVDDAPASEDKKVEDEVKESDTPKDKPSS